MVTSGVRRVLLRRIAEIEARVDIHAGPGPALFLEIVDASVPDEGDDAEVALAWAEGARPIGEVTGVRESVHRGCRVAREAGELVDDLKKRATAMLPDVRVFWFEYG